MDLIIRLVMLFIIFYLLMLCVRLTMPFPRYFRNGSMRVVPGEENNEYRVEMLNGTDSDESWVYVTTLHGLSQVFAYMDEQNEKQSLIRRIWRRWHR